MDFRQDTIVAKATASGAGAIGVIRISGNKCFEILSQITRGSLPQSHEIKVRKFYADGQLIDEGMLAVFPGPNSFSGEDMGELYIHGSDFIASRLLQACLDCGCRLADPGEFTLRAYLNGKLDLAQAEAVADLIAAQSEGAHKLALNQLRGGVSLKIAGLRAQILEFAALIELELDFGEEDVEFASRTELRSKLEKLHAEISALLNTFKSGNAIKDGVPVAIVGKPNAGKSTLLNALLKEERAIVTDIPGTTRDTIEEYFYLEGIKFRLIDTAGIRKSNDVVEELGIQRTYDSLSKAALVMLVADASADSTTGVNEMLKAIVSRTPGEVWLVLNKSDVGTIEGIENAIGISAGTGSIGALTDNLSQFAKKLMSDAADTTISHLRHAEALTQAHRGIHTVIAAMDSNQSGDILAFELRNAMSELGKITGEIDSQDILGEIFGKFCIGK